MPSKKADRSKRRTEIMRTISEAMKALSAKKPMAWDRENSETIAAGERLDNAMADYVSGKVTREQVKAAYKNYADLHIA